jgi:Phage integrase, N-terminal SAM-like domain
MSGRELRLAAYRRVRVRATSSDATTSSNPAPRVGRRPGRTGEGRAAWVPRVRQNAGRSARRTPPAGAPGSSMSGGGSTVPPEPAPRGRDSRGEKANSHAWVSALMAADLAVQTWKEEEMRHPSHVWTDPAFADEPLQRLRDEWKRHLSAGTGKRSEKTVRKYLQDLDDFARSLERHGLEPVLGSVTPDAVNLWVADQESRGNSPHSIAGRVISLKTFVSKYIHRTLELTTVDLLRKVARPSPALQPRQVLAAEELDSLLAVYYRDTFEDVRDRAMMATFAATGLRFDAVRTLALEA